VVVAAAIVVWFFAITGIVHMFKTGSFAKAFAVGEIYHLIGRIGILRYLGWIGVAIVLGAIIGIFDAIPVIGWLISAFLSLLLLIFITRSIGLIYDDVTGIPTAQTGTDRAEAPAQMPQGAAVAVAATAPASASAPASTEAQQKVYCVHCGAENRPEFKYCFKCGKEIFRQ
ncbi:MAG TPA: zinc-ribbon domain-containing protein, partial [Candidatus Methanomethylicus sp.]|nr:zinc-ribbon domain-containing protein [Candidatus Methanomethylicus sp.]